MGFKLGDYFVAIRADLSEIKEDMNKVQNEVVGAASRIGGKVAALVGGFLAVGSLTNLIKDSFEATRALDIMAAKSFGSVEAFSALQHAAQRSDVEVHSLNSALQSLPYTLEKVQLGLDQKAATSLARVGVSIRQLRSLKMEDQFLTLAEAISQTQSPFRQLEVATDIFGESGRDLLPMLLQGASGVQRLMDEAKALGVVLDKETARKVSIAHQSILRFKSMTKASARDLLVILAPALTFLADTFLEFRIRVKKTFEVIAPILGKFIDSIKKLTEITVEQFDRIIDKIEGPLLETWELLKDIVEFVSEEIVASIKDSIDSIFDVFKKLAEGASFSDALLESFKGISLGAKILLTSVVASSTAIMTYKTVTFVAAKTSIMMSAGLRILSIAIVASSRAFVASAAIMKTALLGVATTIGVLSKVVSSFSTFIILTTTAVSATLNLFSQVWRGLFLIIQVGSKVASVSWAAFGAIHQTITKGMIAMNTLFQGSFLAVPVIVATSIAGAVAAIYYFRDSISQAFDQALLTVETVVSSIVDIASRIPKFFAAHVSVLKVIMDGMIEVFGNIVPAIASFVGQIYATVSNSFGQMGTIFTGLSQLIGKFFSWLQSSSISMMQNLFAVFSAGLPSIGELFGQFRATVQETWIFTKFSFQRIGSVSELLWVQLKYSFVKIGAEVAHLFGTVIPQYASFGVENWEEILTDMWNITKSVFTNMRDNVISIMKEIWDFVTSGGTDKIQIDWTPLTEGFERTLRELPEIAEREIGPLEQSLKEQVDKAAEGVGQDFAKFLDSELSSAGILETLKNSLSQISDFTGDLLGFELPEITLPEVEIQDIQINQRRDDRDGSRGIGSQFDLLARFGHSRGGIGDLSNRIQDALLKEGEQGLNERRNSILERQEDIQDRMLTQLEETNTKITNIGGLGP